MSIRTDLALITLVSGLATPLAAATVPPTVVGALEIADVWIREVVEYDRWPGVAVGVVHGGEVIWAKGYGLADPATGREMTPTTRLRLGSVSKIFTATAIVQLRDRGKLRLDDPLADYLPGFTVGGADPATPPITIRHLLTHTSGLPREGAFPYWTSHQFPTRDELVAAVAGQRLMSEPGAAYRYSNLGIALLGAVVEEASGRPWAAYLQDELLRPLGMSDSTAAPTAPVIESLAAAHMRRMADGSRRLHSYYDAGGVAPAANVISTVEDLARFAAFHLGHDGNQVLAASSRREMQRAQFVGSSWSSGRGLGFAVSHGEDRDLVAHGGWIGGHRSHLLLSPEDDLAVIVLTNADDASPSSIATPVLAMVAEALASSSSPSAADPGWKRYEGRYTDPWGWEYEVLVAGDRLAMMGFSYPPADDPREDLTFLEPTATQHEFRLPDGDPVRFEIAADGSVASVTRRYDVLLPLAAPATRIERDE